MRKKLLGGANSFLEQQFLREMEILISKFPHEANLGGRPDIVSKVKAYIRLRAARKDLVPDNTELQLIKGDYIWAIVFYLLRSGHVPTRPSTSTTRHRSFEHSTELSRHI